MPMTFLSHQAVVLPLKVGAPRWFSGTALVLGSMAPDVEYHLRGYPSTTVSHTWPGQFTFCLPVTLILFLLVTRVIAEPVAANAPEVLGLRVRDYARLRDQPATVAHWTRIVTSALIGSASHVALDEVTDRLGSRPYHALDATPVLIAINLLAWVALGLVTLAIMRYIGRGGLLRRWAMDRAGRSEPGGEPSRPRLSLRLRAETWPVPRGAFWLWTLFGLTIGGALGALYRRPGFHLNIHATWVHIWLSTISGGFVGLLIASIAWHVRRTRLAQLRGGQQ